MTDLSGRYYYVDTKTGRKFCIEPIADRDQRVNDQTFKNGGAPVKGGAIREEDSIITEENGFFNIVYLPPGISPDMYIQQLIDQDSDDTP